MRLRNRTFSTLTETREIKKITLSCLFIPASILMLVSSNQSLCKLLKCLNLPLELMQFRMKPFLLPQLHLQHIGSVPHRHHARELRLHPLQPCFQFNPLLLEALLLLLHFVGRGGSYPAFHHHVDADNVIFTSHTNQCLHRAAGLTTAHIRRCGN